jgi:hypothetical protein
VPSAERRAAGALVVVLAAAAATTLLACARTSSPNRASTAAAGAPAPLPAADVRIDAGEADAALAILARRRSGGAVTEGDWRRLWESDGYRRLRQREEAMGRAFADSDFAAFLLSDTLAARASALARTVADWKRLDLSGAAARAFAYLPAEARIRATLYLVIKPRTNTFVFDVRGPNPAIFAYVDPTVTRAQLENTLAHELHHIGYDRACHPRPVDSTLPPRARTAVAYMAPFGEGYAMLAAAGSADVHPHLASDSATRARWERDVANAEADLRKLEGFFVDILDGRIASPDSLNQVAFSFFGEQGPWYTVGWVMGSTIERVHGRRRLVDALCDQRALAALYQSAARELNRRGGRLPLWSDSFLARIGAGTP